MLVAVAHAADAAVREAYLGQLSTLADVRFLADGSELERQGWLREAIVLVTFSPPYELKEPEMAALGELRFVQCLAAGRDRFPFEAFASCTVAFNQGAAAEPIGEHALALVLAAAKNLFARHNDLAAGHFKQSGVNMRLAGGTAAVIGLGAIGSRVAYLLRAMGMKFRAINSSGRTALPVELCRTLDGLHEVLDGADIVIVAIELNRQTKDLIGAAQLRLLKPDGSLVNVSRAAVVQPAALYAHLLAQPGFRAGLDVWWNEPMHGGQFKLEHHFLDLPNVIGSPHNSPMVHGIFAALIGEYANALATAMGALTTTNAQTVAKLAQLPDIVRGYGEVKLANVVKFRDQLAGLVSKFATHGVAAGQRQSVALERWEGEMPIFIMRRGGEVLATCSC